MGQGAAFVRERIRNHGLRRWGVRRFPHANQSAQDDQEQESRSEAARDGSQAPECDATGDDARPAEAVGEESGWKTGNRQDHQEPGLQRAELRVRDSHLLAEKRQERHHHLAVGKVDKIDQSKYSKKTKLVGRKRNGL